MTRTALLFDLDGTLIDSIELILGAAEHAFADFPGRRPTREEWRATIGRPLRIALGDYATDDLAIDDLHARYRAYQVEHHDAMIKPYEGIIDMLRRFAREGHALAVVTSKADWLAVKALELVGVSELFSAIVGCDTCTNFKPHPEPVERALALLGTEAKSAVFVGDTVHDIESGRSAGVYSIAVTWGAFSATALTDIGADVVVHDVPALECAIRDFDASVGAAPNS